MKKIYFFIFIFTSCYFVVSTLTAQWPTTPDSALHVGFGAYPMLTVDPNDESITVVYLIDERIESKKFDRYGYPMWGGMEIALVDTPGTAWVRHWAYPSGQWGQIISDDSGGAIICWEDYRNAPLHPFTFEPEGSEVFIQRVDVNGQVRFGANGKRISGPATDGFRWIGDMKTDYHSGFVLSYNYTFAPYYGFLKKYDIKGNEIWERMFPDGFNIDVNTTDNCGNIFVSYGGSYGQPNRRMKLDLQGNYLWPDTLDGKIPDSKSYRRGGAFSDGMGGAIGVGDGYLKINRVDSTGQFVFGDNGINLGGGQLGRIGYASDDTGGIYVTWTKNYLSKIQRINKNGIIVFDSTGLTVSQDSFCVIGDRIIHDNNHGFITIWSGENTGNSWPLFAQRIDSTGQFLWGQSSVLFNTNTYEGLLWPAITIFSDGRGGAIHLWTELSNGILMKQISKNGNIGEIISGIDKNKNNRIAKQYYLYLNYPNPFNNSTEIKFVVKQKSTVNITIYNVLGKTIRHLYNRQVSTGTYKIIWDCKNNNEEYMSSGIYFLNANFNNEYNKTIKLLLLK